MDKQTKFTTFGLWDDTHRRLKVLAARLGKSMAELIHEWVIRMEQELEKQN